MDFETGPYRRAATIIAQVILQCFVKSEESVHILSVKHRITRFKSLDILQLFTINSGRSI